MLSDHAHALAARFRQVNADVIRFAQACSPEHWRRMVPHEGRSVAYLIDHIAYAYGVETKIMLECVTGQEQPRAWDELPPTFTLEDMHAINAARWAANPYPDQQETIARLQAEGEKTATVIENLSEAEMQQTVTLGPLGTRTVAQFIERPLIGHPRAHMPGIRQELAPSSPT
jgi:hypothetical protein